MTHTLVKAYFRLLLMMMMILSQYGVMKSPFVAAHRASEVNAVHEEAAGKT